MIELYQVRAHIEDLHREAAAFALAKSAPVAPTPARERRQLSAGEVELRIAQAYSRSYLGAR